MAKNLEEHPLPASPLGERMVQTGYSLVRDHGVRLDRILWDADEVLWDWLMDFGVILRGVPRFVLRPDMGHREHVRLKPGLFELLWGMHRASLAEGLDPHLRIWTNGYAYRLHVIAQHIPGFHALTGLPAPAQCTAEDVARHPRFFFRHDYTDALAKLLEPGEATRFARTCPAPSRRALARHLERHPFDPNFKVPDLAPLVGKGGFTQGAVLVDDMARNVRRFVTTARRAVRIQARSRFVLGGRVPNSVWRHPSAALQGLFATPAPSLAGALKRVFRADGPSQLRIRPTAPPDHQPVIEFEVEIPDQQVRAGWIAPRKELRRLLQVPADRERLSRTLREEQGP